VTGSNYLNYGGDSIFRDPSENIKVCGSATDPTIEHYQRPEIKAAIIAYCTNDWAIRALNGDNGWYKRAAEPGKVQLTTPDDYDFLIRKHRTLYATLDLLDPGMKAVSERWDDRRGAPEKPIGTLANCLAFTLSVDIDSIRGPNGEDITTSPEIKSAVEAAGQFFVDYLREHGVRKSVHCLSSGGGIYHHIHHALFRSNPDWSPEDRDHAFRSATSAFNSLIGDISKQFFEQHPECKGKVKFDQLNNQKRKFKTLFSIHKRLPFAVIPLNPDHIEIDFAKAKLPLSFDVLAEGACWYQSYDLGEKEALKKLLAPYVEQAEGEMKERKVKTGNYEIPRFSKPIPPEKWPPCMKNIFQKAEPGLGPHRALAVLAAYLYQAGWPEDEAFKLWESVAERAGVEARIFDQWYGLMSCPSCQTLQSESAGYPKVGLGGLGYCEGCC